MEKVFVYESVWENGAEIEGGVSVRLFTTKEKAIEAMKSDVEEIRDTFLDNYDEEDLRISETDTYIEIYVDGYDDCWTGNVYEKEIE